VSDEDEPIYRTREECRRVALAAFDSWVPGLRLALETAIAEIDKAEIREGLWGPDALVGLIEDTVNDHLQSDSLANPAMAAVVETDRRDGLLEEDLPSEEEEDDA
jgi:hypothetical protein